ncbi:MAG: GAF domain-containing protein, partial [Planctomycetota bacterium]
MPQKDHLKLLVDVGELHALLSGSGDFHTFLQRVVSLVADHMATSVVSIYLFHEIEEELVLEATHGLAESAAGQVRLGLGEGLVGLALKELRPIVEAQASTNPNFKHFPSINEERYESFLAVPIRRGISRIGVLVAQREERAPFTRADTSALRATASQLATAIENGRALIDLQAQRVSPGKKSRSVDLPSFIRGKGASDASAQAPAAVLQPEQARTKAVAETASYTLED